LRYFLPVEEGQQCLVEFDSTDLNKKFPPEAKPERDNTFHGAKRMFYPLIAMVTKFSFCEKSVNKLKSRKLAQIKTTHKREQ